MRKIVLALFLTLAALTAGIGHAAAMDGFDLGDMPPLPPPLLDDSPVAPPLTPPQGGAASPLAVDSLAPPPATGSASPVAPAAGVTPAVPPIDAGLGTGADAGGMDFASPLPPAPPVAPPPGVSPPSAIAGGAASVSGPAAPQAIALPGQLGDPAATMAAGTPAIPEAPRPGRIDGGRVNVRAGPNTQYESIAVLTSGAPVTVLARHGEWYKIVFPADQLASIHKNFVTADITGEIPEAGLPGVVNQDNASVHAFYWDKSTVVGSLQKGAPVTIKQERGQWYRIVPPENARAFVFASYVRVDGNAADIAADAVPAPVNPAVDLSAEGGRGGASSRPVKLSKDQERVLELKESYYKRLQERFDTEIAAEEAEEKAALEARKLQATQLDSALKDLDSRLSAIDQETSQRIEHIAREFLPQQTMVTGIGAAAWAPPDPAGGGYTGWIENIGRVGGAPTPYRLTKGGEVRFYLVSNQFNLEEYANRRVWLNGPVEYAGSAAASVLQVDQIRILTELEIAEDMRRQQQQQYGGGAEQGYDPYAAATASSYGTTSYGTGTATMIPDGAVTEYAPSGAPTAGMGANSGMGMTGGYELPSTVGTAPQPYAGYGMDGTTGGMTNGANGGIAVPAYIDPVTGAVYSTPPAGVASEPYLVPGQVYSGAIPSDSFASEGFAPAQPQMQPQMMTAPIQPAPMAQGGMSPSDPSQLPDIVSSGSNYTASPLPGIDIGGAMTTGEVDTDSYERPIINEIIP